jgi:hypothetical protein
MPAPLSALAARRYARIAGLLLLLSLLAGLFGELYVPSKLAASTDTLARLRAHELLYRLGFASYLVEATCDVGLTVLFYLLLRPVQRELALAATAFGLVSTAVFAAAELFCFAPTLLLSGAEYLNVFTPDQLNAFELLSLKLYGLGGGIFMVFYGAASLIRGVLIFRSGYFPRALGLGLVLAGLGFILQNLVLC